MVAREPEQRQRRRVLTLLVAAGIVQLVIGCMIMPLVLDEMPRLGDRKPVDFSFRLFLLMWLGNGVPHGLLAIFLTAMLSTQRTFEYEFRGKLYAVWWVVCVYSIISPAFPLGVIIFRCRHIAFRMIRERCGD